MLKINKEILSFKDIPSMMENSGRSILLIRHSYRESLKNGNIDPGLTAEGWDYAVECGRFLKGIKEVCFGASPRKRTLQTVQGLMEGGELGDSTSNLTAYPQLYETALFSSPEALDISLENNTLPRLLKTFFTTGSAPTMVGMKEFAEKLADFLTGTEFEKKNVILASHDIILMTLLLHYEVYAFHEEDWCGYVQGAFLHQDMEGNWTLSYTVPDKENRKKHRLFV